MYKNLAILFIEKYSYGYFIFMKKFDLTTF